MKNDLGPSDCAWSTNSNLLVHNLRIARCSAANKNGVPAALALVALLLVIAVSPCFGGRPMAVDDLVQIDALLAIGAATSLPALERSHASVCATDPIVEIAYGMRLLDLGDRNHGEEVLLRSIPKNDIEFTVLAVIPEACRRRGVPLSATVCRIPDNYPDVLASVVRKHPSYFGAFLSLKQFADGTMADELDDMNRSLEKSNRKAFVKALRSLPPSARRAVCGECVEELRP